MNIFGKRSDLPFSRKSDRKKDKSVVSFSHEQNIICSQTLELILQSSDQLHFQFVLVVQLAVIKDTVNVVCEKAYPFLAKWCGQYVKSGALLTGG